MSWWNSDLQKQYDDAQTFLQTGNTKYLGDINVYGVKRQGCWDSSRCGAGYACVGGYCKALDSPLKSGGSSEAPSGTTAGGSSEAPSGTTAFGGGGSGSLSGCGGITWIPNENSSGSSGSFSSFSGSSGSSTYIPVDPCGSNISGGSGGSGISGGSDGSGISGGSGGSNDFSAADSFCTVPSCGSLSSEPSLDPSDPSGGSGGSGGGGGIPSGDAVDCCGARCCRFTAYGATCWCGECPPPGRCDSFCAAYRAANGVDAPGCEEGDSCSECEDCISYDFGYECKPKNNAPCNCPTGRCSSGCQKCDPTTGLCIQDTNCEPPPPLLLDDGDEDEDEDPCKQNCTSVSRCSNQSCPAGYATKGTICSAEECCVVCEKCETVPGSDCGPQPCDCNCHDDCPDCFLCGTDGECYPDPNCAPANGVGVWKLETTGTELGSTLALGKLIEIPEPSTTSKRIVQVNTAVDVSDVITWTPDTDDDTEFTVESRSVAKKDISYWDVENCPRSASTGSGAIYVRTYDSGGAWTGAQTRISSRGSLRVNCDYATAEESNTLTYVGPGEIRDWWSVSALPGAISGGILTTSLPIPAPDLSGPP